MTFLDTLNSLKDRLLQALPLFAVGYPYARLDANKGLVVTAGNDARYVGLNDTDGNYFYIRVPEKINVAAWKGTSDCGVGTKQRYPCTLVAAVLEADEFALADAIVNEMLKTKVIEVKAIWIDAISIVDNEFKGLSAESIEAAKARIGDRTIVRIDFDMTRTYESNNCEYNICPTC